MRFIGYVFELSLFTLIAVTAITQVWVPYKKGLPLFPTFRHKNVTAVESLAKAKEEEALLDVKEETFKVDRRVNTRKAASRSRRS